MTTRRTFLTGAAAVAALTPVPASLWAQALAASSELVFTVDPQRKLATMPLNFTGLSYETAQLGHPEYFSTSNKPLIALIRLLGKQGVLRIGGNTSDFTSWSDNDADAAKNNTPKAIGPDAGTGAQTASIITPHAIRNLNAFAEAIDWQVIYGLNLKRGTVENAVAEAKCVAATLGSRLLAFQIGNEPDHSYRIQAAASAPVQTLTLTFEEYFDRWTKFHDAVRKAVPSARFAGPDNAGHYEWLAKMEEKHADVDFFTAHFYAEGPPSDPSMTLEYLLRRGKLATSGQIPLVQKVMAASGKPFRLTEGNSCFHGGKLGVSDTVASALWGGDFMLQLAQAGYCGVNLHGGGNGYYTPIAGDIEQGFIARPVFYGMLLAERFVGSSLVETSLSTQTEAQNVTGFAASSQDGWKLALFNKAPNAVEVSIKGLGATHATGKVTLMHGKQIDAKDGVTFGDSSVTPDGAFSPKPQQAITFRGGQGRIELPAYTAAYIQI